jgi:YD repeat-containing protein
MRDIQRKGSLATIGFLVLIASGLLFLNHLHADTATYTYDANGRLLKADYGGGKGYTYAYDKAGNILTETVVGNTVPTYTLQVSVSPTGGGSVTGGGINCPGQCSVSIPQNQGVALTASTQSGFKFLGWGGNASGTTNPVTVTMNAAKGVTAFFGSTTGSTDTDGVTDWVEMGPLHNDPAYDGNGDGIADYQQSNVASLPVNTGGTYVTLAVTSAQALSNVSAVGNPSPGDMPSVFFPYGFFEFDISGMGTGGCTAATLYLPLTPWLSTYYKYGATPDNYTLHWYDFMYNGTTGAEILHEASRTRVVLHFCDGQRGDDDYASNGLIIDQGGPGAPWNTAYVSKDGLCNGHGPCFSAVQQAISSASGATILRITQANYVENIVLNSDQAVTLEGGWDTNFTSSSSYTTIQGSIMVTDGTVLYENIILK